MLRAVRDGAELAEHVRQTGRGPYYTLAGRRLSVVTFKELEVQRFITRGSTSRSARVVYSLTSAGEAALAEWEASRS